MSKCEGCKENEADFSISVPFDTCIGEMSESHRYCKECILYYIPEDHYVEIIRI